MTRSASWFGAITAVGGLVLVCSAPVLLVLRIVAGRPALGWAFAALIAGPLLHFLGVGAGFSDGTIRGTLSVLFRSPDPVHAGLLRRYDRAIAAERRFRRGRRWRNRPPGVRDRDRLDSVWPQWWAAELAALPATGLSGVDGFIRYVLAQRRGAGLPELADRPED